MTNTDTTSGKTMDDCQLQTSHHISLWKAVPSWPFNYGFVLFNLSAYTVLAGPALILMLRNWNASAFQIGILLSMMPATQLIQLFIAPYIERVGIHKFVIGGLVSRNIFNSIVMILPFMVGYFGTQNSLYVLLAIMFFVDMSHSIGYAGWMTWITWLVPESHRGRYFSVEQLMNTGGATLISLASGFILGKTPVNEKFGIFLAIGALIGWISIAFLCRIPRPPLLENLPKPEMFWHWIKPVIKKAAFRRLLYVCFSNTMLITIGSFGVLYMTEELKITQDWVFYMGATGTLACAVSVYFWGVLADRFGSKPVMALGLRLVLIGAIYWFAVALGFPYHSISVIIAFGVVSAVGIIAYVITCFRYVCSSLPREHMVYGTIIFNLSVQISASIGPLIWGRMLDMLEKVNFYIGPLHIHRFTPLYLLMLAFASTSVVLVQRLPDTEKSVSPFAVGVHGIREVWNTIKKLGTRN